MTIQDAVKGGLDVVLAIAVVALWTRLNLITDRFIERFDKGDAERQAIATRLGVTAQDVEDAKVQIKRY